MTNISVVKRDGSREPFDANKINLALVKASEGLEDQISKVVEVASQLQLTLFDGITTEQLDEAVIQTALQNVKDDPEFDTVAEMRPDRVAVYGYAHMPHLFKPQKQLDASLLPSGETKLALLQLAIEKLTAAGYLYIGMDHFALPDDELALAQARGGLHRNFMGYTTHADSDLVGLGVSAISHIGDSFSQNPRDLPSWQAALDEGRLPVFRGMRMNEDDQLRADLIQQLMCQGEIPVAALERRYAIDFAEYFALALDRLAPLAEDGLVRVEEQRIVVTSRGRLLLRNIAMCFDHYLDQPATVATPRFSRAI